LALLKDLIDERTETLQAKPRGDKANVSTFFGIATGAFIRTDAERALAHTVENKVEAAYHRTDLLEQRHPMMEAWAGHVCNGG
jgi:hypothetical protein